MKRKFYSVYRLFALFVLVIVMILTACGSETESGTNSESSSNGLTPVTLQLKWVPQAQFAGYYVALEKGYYEEEGLDVTIAPGGPDIVPEQQVANGAAHIGVDWVASLLPHIEQGLPLVQIAQIYQESGLLLISKKDAGIESPEDLEDKNVGNWMGGNEFELLALFDKYGFDPNSDLSFVKQAFTMDQFLSGELDAASAMTYNEYHVVLESGVSESDLNVIDMNDEGVAMLEDNLFANKEWLEENKETAAKFLRASIKGWQEAIKNPEGAVDIIMAESEEGSSTREHQLTMMKEVAKLVVPEGFDPEKIGQTDAEMFQQTADIAHQFGVIEKPANVEEAFTNEIFEIATSQ